VGSVGWHKPLLLLYSESSTAHWGGVLHRQGVLVWSWSGRYCQFRKKQNRQRTAGISRGANYVPVVAIRSAPSCETCKGTGTSDSPAHSPLSHVPLVQP
jgi:hypothetical protein